MLTLFTALTPFLLALLAWTLGLWTWRYQLRAKRRTELAEEALLVFGNAVDAMGSIRAPMSFAGEHAALRKELGEPDDKKLPGEDYQIILWRLDRRNERFAELRRLQLLCKFHFGEAAHNAFEQLHRARHRVWVAAHMGASRRDNDWQQTPENIKLREEWQGAIWAGTTNPDAIADAVNAAQRDLEAILTPHLRADAALLPIAGGWKAGRERFASWRQRRSN